MRLTLHGKTLPCHVLLCATCDKQEGRKNLTEKHGWKLDDAIRWEKNPDHEPMRYGASPIHTPQSISSAAAAQKKERKQEYGRARAFILNTRY